MAAYNVESADYRARRTEHNVQNAEYRVQSTYMYMYSSKSREYECRVQSKNFRARSAEHIIWREKCKKRVQSTYYDSKRAAGV